MSSPRHEGKSESLIQANADDAVAIFSGYDLTPGEARAGDVRIANGASGPSRPRLFESDASNDFAPGELILTIHVVGAGHSLYRGELGGVPADGIDLGKLAPGDERILRFVVRLSPGADPGSRRGAGAVYEWLAAGRDPR